MKTINNLKERWFPVAASTDLPNRHIHQGRLLGQELAIWRADDGHVNVWEDRCAHRSVRLSIGSNDGAELKCQYHGWRYANRTGGCTYIPAHPGEAPNRRICIKTFPVEIRAGFVWTTLSSPEEFPDYLPEVNEESAINLRSITINAPASVVVEHLQLYSFSAAALAQSKAVNPELEVIDTHSLMLTSADEFKAQLYLFVQPLDAGSSAIHGLLLDLSIGKHRTAALRYHNNLMTRMRDLIERERWTASGDLIPALDVTGAPAPLHSFDVTVSRKRKIADLITGFRLIPSQGDVLPTAQPGAHIDVYLPNGLVRQYSITNGPGETDHYQIAVKREPESRGGSAFLHDELTEGDTLRISAPINRFPLRRDALRNLLVAGGIGITPLISMAQALFRSRLPFDLHYFVQAEDSIAFKDLLEEMSGHVHFHVGLDPSRTKNRLEKILGPYSEEYHLYVCGPGPMLAVTRELATIAGWPEEAVHFEHFSNELQKDQSSDFEIRLARSGMTMTIPADKTVLEVLRENEVDIPSSCEQGVCGTCMVSVLEGVPQHNDVFLSDDEKEAGTCMMACVSRSLSGRLVLDL